MLDIEEFRDYFDNEFVIRRKSFNAKLAKAKKVADIFRLLTICFVTLFCALLICFAIALPKYVVYVSVIGVVIFCVLLAFSYYDMFIKEEIKEKFENKDKAQLVSAILQKDFEYVQRGKMTLDSVKSCKLLPKCDVVDGEDYFVINVETDNNSAKITCSDIYLKNVEKTDGNAEETSVFNGFMLHAELDKSLKFCAEVNVEKPTKKYELFQTDSNIFNQNFKVFVADNKKAEKIFRAGLMLALVNLQLTIKVPMSLIISDKDIYLVAQKDLFQLNLESKVAFDSVVELWTELSSCVNIVKEIIK